jgi:hypothetical protein
MKKNLETLIEEVPVDIPTEEILSFSSAFT